MGHHHHGAVLRRQLLHNRQHLARQLGVQCTGRLIKEHHLGVAHQGACYGYPLLLSAGKPAGIFILFLRQAHFFQQDHAFFFGIGRAGLCQQVRLDEIFPHRHVGKQIKALEHHAHFADKPGTLCLGTVFPVLHHGVLAHIDAPTGHFLQVNHAAQQGGFSPAGGPDNGNHFALLHRQADAPQDLRPAFKGLFHIFQPQYTHPGHPL